MYDVEIRTLKQAVRRNINPFPSDFLIMVLVKEWKELITICDNLPEKVKFSPVPPFAFTEQGVAMISSYMLQSTTSWKRIRTLENCRIEGELDPGKMTSRNETYRISKL
jgi:hypothetical protein